MAATKTQMPVMLPQVQAGPVGQTAAPASPVRVTMPVTRQVRYVYQSTPNSPPPRVVQSMGSPTTKVVYASPMPVVQGAKRTVVSAVGSPAHSRLPSRLVAAAPPVVMTEVAQEKVVAEKVEVVRLADPPVEELVQSTPTAAADVTKSESTDVPKKTVEEADEACKLMPSVGTWQPHVTTKQLETAAAPSVGDLVMILSTSNTEKFFRQGVHMVFRIAADAKDGQPYQVVAMNSPLSEPPFDVWLFRRDVRLLTIAEIKEAEEDASHSRAQAESCLAGCGKLFSRRAA